jgi:4-amino-4-deoxy-L-arabinose transferase-like glycosyltransferase
MNTQGSTESHLHANGAPGATSPASLGKFAWQNLSDWQIAGLLALLAAILLLPTLGSYPFIDPSDGWYAEVAREMVEAGNFLTPHLNYQPWFEKPILIYWLIAACYKTFGVSEFAARLPSALSAVALVPVCYIFAVQYIQRRAALIAAIALTACPLTMVIGHMCLTDLPLTLFLTVSIASFFYALTKKASWQILLAAYGALSLAILLKGPLGLFLVGVNVGAFLLLSSPSAKAFWQSLLKLKPIYGIIFTALVSVPWYVVEAYVTKGAFVEEFFFKQNFQRATGSLDHRLPFWFYIPVVIGGFFPWSFFTLSLLPQLINKFLRKQLSKEESQFVLFLGIWFTTIFVFFSVVPSKLPTYVLPAFPALAILTALMLNNLFETKKLNTIKWTGIAVFAIGAGLLTAIFKLNHKYPDIMTIMVPLAMVTALWLDYAINIFRGHLKTSLAVLTVASIFSVGILVPLCLQIDYKIDRLPYHQLLREAEDNHIDPVVCTRFRPSSMFYVKHKLVLLPSVDDMISYLNTNPPTSNWYIVQNSRLNVFSDRKLAVKIIDSHGGWNLLSVSK